MNTCNYTLEPVGLEVWTSAELEIDYTPVPDAPEGGYCKVDDVRCVSVTVRRWDRDDVVIARKDLLPVDIASAAAMLLDRLDCMSEEELVEVCAEFGTGVRIAKDWQNG